MNRLILREQLDKKELEECTFNPTTTRSSNRYSLPFPAPAQLGRWNTADDKPIEQRTFEWEKRRSTKMEYEKFKKKNSELDDCTFSPDLSVSKSRPSTAPVIQGYERYMEARDRARKKKETEKVG